MTELLLIDALVERLKKLFKGYVLLNKSGVLQEVKIFAQYLPQPAGITIATKKKRGVENYEAEDYDANFPCVIVKAGEIIDNEQGRMDSSICDIKLLTGIYDGVSEDADEDEKAIRRQMQGYRDIMNIHERIREDFMNERVTAQRFRMCMPLKARLLEADTWPLYFGEMEMKFEIGRPMMKDFVYKMQRRV